MTAARTPRRIVAVNAGLGDPSSTRLLVDRLVEAVVGALDDGTGAGAVDVTVIDLRDLATDIARSMATGFAVDPVREALQRLETQSLLTRDGRSLIVASLDHNQLAELYVVRAELEALAARLEAQSDRNGQNPCQCWAGVL